MFGSLDISGSALVAQRVRLDTIAGNIANANVTRQADGEIRPYRRREVLLAPGDDRTGPGVFVDDVVEDPSDFKLRFDPGHPDRFREGPLRDYVAYPNVNVTTEYINAIEAGRAYEANIAMMNITKEMLRQSIRLFA